MTKTQYDNYNMKIFQTQNDNNRRLPLSILIMGKALQSSTQGARGKFACPFFVRRSYDITFKSLIKRTTCLEKSYNKNMVEQLREISKFNHKHISRMYSCKKGMGRNSKRFVVGRCFFLYKQYTQKTNI